ncbi:MAG: SirB2 family protein [bacterium]|nr:SirB2 family protein [bacterium]
MLSVVNDTFLLAFGVSMAVISSQYPFRETWLTAKLVGLVVYVVLGTIALKRGETKAIRVTAGICSLFVVIYIVFVAISRMPIVFSFMPA